MNIMRIKFITLCFLLISIRYLAAENLGMFVDVKRYFDDNKNTQFIIDYQVPYKNMMFKARQNGYYAELKVVLSISNADSVVYTKEFINNIGVTSKYDVSNSSKTFLDRISLTLAKPGIKLKIHFEDLNGQKDYDWHYSVALLNPNDKLSDIELISSITSDTTSFSPKFLKNREILIPEPSGLISRDVYDTLYIQCDAYTNSSETAKAIITISTNNTEILINTVQIGAGDIISLLFPINLDALGIGKFQGKIEYVDNDIVFSRSFEFIVTEHVEMLNFLFSDTDEEYKFMKYLISIRNQTTWNSMSKEAKRRKISQLWENLSIKLNQPIDALLKIYKERIDYTNANFSHFEKGWKTDMGRIYIRNGRPDEIDVDTSSDDTRFVRKDYQIWKYSSKNHAVYLFVDIPMNGNFKLVYADNDDEESTYPDWRKYVGSDFDESRLDN